MKAIVENESGYLFTGLFFCVDTNPDPSWKESPHAWVSRPAEGKIDYIIRTDTLARKVDVLSRCSLHPESELQEHCKELILSLAGGAHGTSVIAAQGSLIVHSQLRDELLQHGFSHLRFLPVTDQSPRGSWGIVPLFDVCADGPWLARAPRTIPEDSAMCIYCCKSPIVCQECGRVVKCRFCDGDSRFFLPPPDVGTIFESPKCDPSGKDRYWANPLREVVLDFSRWDGSDVCFTLETIVTGRLADALIDAHADPLRLTPLRSYAPDPKVLPRFQSQFSRREWRHPSGVPNWQNVNGMDASGAKK